MTEATPATPDFAAGSVSLDLGHLVERVVGFFEEAVFGSTPTRPKIVSLVLLPVGGAFLKCTA